MGDELNDDEVPTGKSRATWLAGFVAAGGLNLLSLSGIADAVVDWRCFLNIATIVATYEQLRAWLFGLLPLTIPDALQHYVLLTSTFGAMLNGYSLATTGAPYSISYAPKSQPFAQIFFVLFYLIPWIFLIWSGTKIFRQALLAAKYKGLAEFEELDDAYRETTRRLSIERRTYIAVVILYPAFCLALLFLFSDFAYKVFDANEIAGIPFEQNCFD